MASSIYFTSGTGVKPLKLTQNVTDWTINAQQLPTSFIKNDIVPPEYIKLYNELNNQTFGYKTAYSITLRVL